MDRSMALVIFLLLVSPLILLPLRAQSATLSQVESVLNSECGSVSATQTNDNRSEDPAQNEFRSSARDLPFFLELKKMRYYDRGARLVVQTKGDPRRIKFLRDGKEISFNSRLAYANVDQIETGENQSVTVKLKSGHELTIGPKTVVKLDEAFTFLDRSIKLFLDVKGKVRIAGKSLQRKKRFAVETPHAVTSVRGTDFAISSTDSGEEVFELNEGAIDLWDPVQNKLLPIKEGQSLKLPPVSDPRPKNITVTCTGNNPSLTILEDPLVGGVRIHFDGMDGRKTNEADMLDFYRKAQDLIKNSNRNSLRVEPPRKEALRIVSLDHIVATKARTLGGLTRINGYVIEKEGKVFLVGKAESGKTPIETELLVVALRSIWKEGKFPFVSLDPDPREFEGKHKVRIGGMPEDIRDSAFTRIMVEADYRMKEISLGAVPSIIEGFKSYKDIVSGSPSGNRSVSRFWLAPNPSMPGDILATSDGLGDALIYKSDAVVQTEKMRRVSALDLFYSSSDTADENAQKSADMFNRFFGELAVDNPSFAQLRTVFDVAKLSAIWRARNLKAPAIESLAASPVKRVEIAEHYDGISERFQSGNESITLAGGAISSSSLALNTTVETKLLLPLIEAASQLDFKAHSDTVEIEFPTTYSIAPESLRFFSASHLLREAYVASDIQQYDRAIHELNLALKLDPDFDEARGLRALLHFILANLNEAESDLNKVSIREPRSRALRSLVLAYTGRSKEAMADADFVEEEYPSNETLLFYISTARILAGELETAERSANRLLNLIPTDSDARSLKEMINLLYGMGQDQAQRYLTNLKAIPVHLYREYALGMGAFQEWKFDEAEAIFDGCSDDLRAYEPEAPATNFYLRERCLIGQIYSIGALDLEKKAISSRSSPEEADSPDARPSMSKAIALSDEFIRMHPDWPTGYLLKAKAAAADGWAADEVLRIYDHALFFRRSDDPLLQERRIELLGSSPVVFDGLTLWWQLAKRETSESTKVSNVLLKRLMWLEPEDSTTAELLNCLSLLDHMSVDDALPSMLEGFELIKKHRSWNASDTWTATLVGALVANAKFQSDGDLKPIFTFLRSTDRENVPVYLLRQISVGRLAVLATLQSHYLKKVDGSEGITTLKQSIAAGEIEIDTFHRAIDDAVAVSLTDLRANGSSFVSSYIESFVRKAVEEILKDYVRQASDTASGLKRELLLGLLGELESKNDLRAHLESQLRTAAGARKAKLARIIIQLEETGSVQKSDVAAWSNALFWDYPIEMAESDVDLWMIKFESEVLSRVVEEIAKERDRTDETLLLSEALQYPGIAIALKRQVDLARESHDWAQWRSRKVTLDGEKVTTASQPLGAGAFDGRAYLNKLVEILRSRDREAFPNELSRETRHSMERELYPLFVRRKNDPTIESGLRSKLRLPDNVPLTAKLVSSAAAFDAMSGSIPEYKSERRVGNLLIVEVLSKNGRSSQLVLVWQSDGWKLDLIESELYDRVSGIRP